MTVIAHVRNSVGAWCGESGIYHQDFFFPFFNLHQVVSTS